MEINNIAILSLYYHNANYGALLQAYALQKKIEELGFNVKQICYQLETGYISDNWQKKFVKEFKYLFSFLKPGYNLARYGFWELGRRRMQEKLYSFAECIPHTKVVTKNTIVDLLEDYDAFICGSDQIWNPLGWQPTLFLDFVKKKEGNVLPVKFSYAASIAKDCLTQDEIQYIRRYTTDFEVISIRENNLVDLLKTSIGRDIKAVPDPCFLLSTDEWRNLMSTKKQYNKDYIFVYFLGDNIDRRDEILTFANNNELEIIYTPFMNKNKAVRLWEKEHPSNMPQYTIGISEFLELICSARFVITDSFHAIVFCLVFNVPFYAFGRNLSRSKESSMNSRLTSLLGDFDMTSRIVESLPQGAYEYTEKDLEKIRTRLNNLKNVGERFLRDTLDIRVFSSSETLSGVT